jgi:stage V sporulation protein K
MESDGHESDILEMRTFLESDHESDDGECPPIFEPPRRSRDRGVWYELNNLIGLARVKRHLHEIIATVSIGKSAGMHTLHLVLTGNPGVGKSTVARLYGRALKDLGVLSGGQTEEHTVSTLTGKYIGHSETNTRDAIKRAQGGVLFIDEAHQLGSAKNFSVDFGRKILDTLIPEMENLRSSFVVIFATYSSKVDDLFDLDPGLRRRVSEVIDFPDYSNSELSEILERMVASDGIHQLEPGLAQKVGGMLGKMRGTSEFANAGSVRNAYEKAIRRLNSRVYKSGTHDNIIRSKDFAFLEDWVAKARGK